MPSIELLNIDCMEYMRTLPDKAFDLAIVDPPYGIDINTSGRLVKEKGWEYKDWDKGIPTMEYFTELSRVSENQIIWGGNYFGLPATRCFLIWDKQQPEGISFASAEYAWTSFDQSAKTFRLRPQGEDRIHPTQKPVKLYRWIMYHFCKVGNPAPKILDTHLGSGSSAIAAHQMGFDFVGCEIDKDYYNAACKRFKEQTMQQDLFKAS
jgi:site-specific DNA-methyltransferase (adenine-specific)